MSKLSREDIIRAEIIQRFNTPSQLKADELERENKILTRKIEVNNKNILALKNVIDREGDRIANQLDKDIPEWRMILVKELKRRS